jgi:hypothetical protein
MTGNSALAGLLQSQQIVITPQQLLKLPTAQIPILSGPAPGSANLIRTIVASLRFGTQPYLAGKGTSAGFYYSGPSRFGIVGDLSLPPSYAEPIGNYGFIDFQILSVAASSGGVSVYTCAGLAGLPPNILAGYVALPSLCSNAANNGSFVVTASTPTSITLNNPSAVLEGSSPAGAHMDLAGSPSLSGGFGGTCDLTNLLLNATGNALQAWTLTNWNFPVPEISGAGIYLGTGAAGGLVAPQNFTQGDGSLLITLEFLQVQL